MACLNTDLCLKVEVNRLVEQNKMAPPSVVLLVPNTNYLIFFKVMLQSEEKHYLYFYYQYLHIDINVHDYLNGICCYMNVIDTCFQNVRGFSNLTLLGFCQIKSKNH